MSALNPNTTSPSAITITIATNATGGEPLGVVLAGGVCQITTGAADTPTVSATALKAAIEAAVSGVSVSQSSGVLTVSADNGLSKMLHAWGYSKDATQTITVTGGAASQTILSSSTAAAGKPAGPSAGYNIGADYATRDASGAATLILRAVLRNVSGAAATAAWRLWVYHPNLGWMVDPAVSVQNVSDAGSSTGYFTDAVVPVSVYGTRVAVELMGKTSAGTNLDAGETLLVWGEVV